MHNNLLERNIYDLKGEVLLCGTCLPRMEPNGFKKLTSKYDTIIYLCLEKEHLNMAITKICGAISTGNIKKITIASVNKSPHCTQLHYLKKEINRIIKDPPPINNLIIANNEIYEISDEALSLSKDLITLTNLIKK